MFLIIITIYGEPLTADNFFKIWASLFPHLSLRDPCNQTGTCIICMKIDQGRRMCGGDNHVKEAFKLAHALHRPFIWVRDRHIIIE